MMQLLSIKKAATVLSVSPEFLKKLQRQGRLRVVRLGRAIRISEQELERLCREEFRRFANWPISLSHIALNSRCARRQLPTLNEND